MAKIRWARTWIVHSTTGPLTNCGWFTRVSLASSAHNVQHTKYGGVAYDNT